jgi:hypothetical protein
MRWVVFVIAVLVIFTVFVTVFAASAKKNEVRLLPKWLWIILCVVVTPIGGLLYLAVGRPLGGPKPTFRRTRVVAPDDDPQFLRDLSNLLDNEDTAPEKKSKKEDEDPEEDKTK